MLLTENMRISEPSESTASFLERKCNGQRASDSPDTVFRPSRRTLIERRSELMRSDSSEEADLGEIRWVWLYGDGIIRTIAQVTSHKYSDKQGSIESIR